MNACRIMPRPVRMRRCLAVLALVAIVARALVPMGFMPVVAHGEAQIVFCDGASAGHALPGHVGHGGPTSTPESPCPFAISGGAAPLPATIDFSLADVVPDTVAPRTSEPVLLDTPPRHSAPRGPPSRA